MAFRNQLKGARLSAGLTQQQVADMIGVTKSTYCGYETGKRKPDVPKIQALSKALNVSGDLLIETGWEEIPKLRQAAVDMAEQAVIERRLAIEKAGGFVPRMVLKPLVGTIPCGNPVEAIQQSDESVEVPDTMHCDFAIRCKGNSMIGARIMDGDIVYIRIQSDVENGEIAAVMVNDDEATLKRVRKTANSVTLWPENPDYEPLVYTGEKLAELRIIGKAVGFTSVVH